MPCVSMHTYPNIVDCRGRKAREGVNRKLTVRSSRRASIRVVTESMHMHTTLSVSVVARNVPRDSRVGRLVSLLKGDGSLDVGVSTEDGDYIPLKSATTSSSRFSPTRSTAECSTERGVWEPSWCREGEELIGAFWKTTAAGSRLREGQQGPRRWRGLFQLTS